MGTTDRILNGIFFDEMARASTKSSKMVTPDVASIKTSLKRMSSRMKYASSAKTTPTVGHINIQSISVNNDDDEGIISTPTSPYGFSMQTINVEQDKDNMNELYLKEMKNIERANNLNLHQFVSTV